MACIGLKTLLVASIAGALVGQPEALAGEPPRWLKPVPSRNTRAVDYDPKPGVLFVEFEQVTLTADCSWGVTTHSSQNCGVVDEDTTFTAWGDPSSRLAVTDILEQVFAPYDLVITTERPDHYVNYDMLVLSDRTFDSSEAETCVLAEPACDGAKRNGIAVAVGGTATCTDPDPVVQAMFAAGTLAGLEGIEDAADPMFFPPMFIAHAIAFQDHCNALTVDPIHCSHIHAAYCDGDETAQSSHQELLGVYGPRTPDAEPPVIEHIFPQDGAVFSAWEEWTLTATLRESSNAVAVKWSFDIPDTGDTFTKCNNRGAGCDDDWNYVMTPVEGPWEFVTVAGAPPGLYHMKFEAQDMYGNKVEELITVEVMDDGDGGEDYWGPDDDGWTDDDDGWTGDDDGWPPGDDGSPDGDPGETDGSAHENTRGCACATQTSPAPFALALPLLTLAVIRRRSTT